jgi:ribosomal protein S1
VQANPWEEFAAEHKRGDKVKGPIKSITDFGVFVGLAAGIDGLVHLSDLSWNEPGEEAVRNYKKGQEVEAIVLAVDVERERISPGHQAARHIGMDRKGRVVQLSIRAKDEAELREVMDEYSNASGGTTKLGALLREQLGGKSE